MTVDLIGRELVIGLPISAGGTEKDRAVVYAMLQLAHDEVAGRVNVTNPPGSADKELIMLDDPHPGDGLVLAEAARSFPLCQQMSFKGVIPFASLSDFHNLPLQKAQKL